MHVTELCQVWIIRQQSGLTAAIIPPSPLQWCRNHSGLAGNASAIDQQHQVANIKILIKRSKVFSKVITTIDILYRDSLSNDGNGLMSMSATRQTMCIRFLNQVHASFTEVIGAIFIHAFLWLSTLTGVVSQRVFVQLFRSQYGQAWESSRWDRPSLNLNHSKVRQLLCLLRLLQLLQHRAQHHRQCLQPQQSWRPHTLFRVYGTSQENAQDWLDMDNGWTMT